MKNNIVLIGFMGTGKSSVGRYVAKKSAGKFIELDNEIVQRAGMSIPAIFAEKGEPFFRAMEASLIAEYSEQEDLIISTGGGAVLNPLNVENLQKKGLLICLTANPEIILDRVEKDNNRPLLAVEDRLGKIRELLAQRAPFYQVADYTIDTSELTVEEIGEHILGYSRGWADGKNANCSGRK